MAVGLAALLAVLAVAAPATAAKTSKKAKAAATAECYDRVNNTYAKLLGCMTPGGVIDHMEAFQAIADANDDPYYPGTRAAGTEGYQESVEYVAGLLEEAGYDVTLDPVTVDFNFPVILRQLTPVTADYPSGAFSGSGDGEVEGQVIPVDLNLTPPRASTSGCEAADFEGIDWSGPADIALVQRGTCFFGDKAYYAEQAGAEAVIIFNQGNTPDREGLIVADGTSRTGPNGETLPVEHGIPVVGASFQQGEALAADGSTAYIKVLPSEPRTNYSVIAEKTGENEDNVVMAGAHLDSVTEGPGINDNASGSAALLETALLMQNVDPVNTIRFAWWAGEEEGLLGSEDYVAGLSEAERDRIALYMNYDMVASPNYIFGVYDADKSTFPAEGVPIPGGSKAIENGYERWYTRMGIPYEDTEFSGRSDYQAFIDNGIPSGGLFTGAEVVKTEAQEEIWGGVAGEQFDPCYHLACDTIANFDRYALKVNSDLIAFMMLRYAYSTRSVNGVEGERVPGKAFHWPQPAGAEGTFQEGEDGGHGPHDPIS